MNGVSMKKICQMLRPVLGGGAAGVPRPAASSRDLWAQGPKFPPIASNLVGPLGPGLSGMATIGRALGQQGGSAIAAALRELGLPVAGAGFESGNRRLTAAELSVLVGKYGAPMATVLADPSYRFFGLPGADGVVGYKPGPRTALAPGGYAGDPTKREATLNAFRDFCRRHGKQMIIYAAGPEVAGWARRASCAVIECSVEQSVDPGAYTSTKGCAAGSKELRKAVRHARAAGVTLAPYRPGVAGARDPELEAAILETYAAWRKEKGDGAYEDVNPFALPDIARFLVARQGKAVVGFLMYHQIEGGKTCLIEHLVQKPGAPRGTSEALVDELLGGLKAEAVACSSAIFGFDALPHLGEISGMPWWSAQLARTVYDRAAEKAGLGRGTKKAYRAKFGEVREAPGYLICDPPLLGPSGIAAVKAAFNL